MARLRKDKGSDKPQKTTAKGGTKTKSKKHAVGDIVSLGGTQEDVELLAGVVDDDIISGDQNNDPRLENDVSSFLQGLKTKKSAPEPATRPSKEKKNVRERKEPTRDKKPSVEEKMAAVMTQKPAEPTAGPSTRKVKLVVEPVSQWYTAIPPLAPVSNVATFTAIQLSDLTTRASNMLAQDSTLYQTSSASTGNSSSDTRFLHTILTGGTLSDRLSALTLLVQSSPVHNTKALETLKAMAERGRGKGGREEGLKAARCIMDWWVGGGAPGRKLKYFRDQPLLHPSVTDQHLVLWYFEDWLKKYFFSVLQVLETFSLDPLPYVRTQSLGLIFTLLRDKPEQEQNLLRLLINKLGDTEKSICSRVSYHLLQLLQAHPNMKTIIVREIKALIFRPSASTSAVANASLAANKPNTHIRFQDEDVSAKKGKNKEPETAPRMERWNTHAWYYAAVTLNQIVLTSNDGDRVVARSLIEVYFEMFREILGAGDKAEAEVEEPVEIPQEDEKKGKRDHRGPKGKARAKEIKGAAGFTEVEDANSRLISAVLAGVNRALPFAKVDVADGDSVFKKHVDTLFLITHQSTFNISLQALMLILQITTSLASPQSSSNPASFSITITDRFYRTLYASLTDPRLSTSNKQAMYLNLLFKALKADKNIERVKAFVRRFVQVLVAGVGGGGGGTEFVAGGLFLLGELFSSISSLKSLLRTSATPASKDAGEYDPRKRDPQYAHASASPMYELLPLLNHYHPAIALHARQLFTSSPLTATPDLSLNTLSHFLDRFVYKNPKKPRTKGVSAMQPSASAADAASGVKLVKGEVAEADGAVNLDKFLKKRAADVPVDQMFFHKFFTQKNEKEKDKAAKAKRRKARGGESEGESDEDQNDSDEESVAEDAVEGAKPVEDDEEADSDKEEAEIWKAMKASMPTELQDNNVEEDSDDSEIPSDMDDDDGSGADEESGEESEAESHQDAAEDDEFVEASDAEDLLSLDEEVPGMIDYDGSDAASGEDEAWGGIEADAPKKRKRDEEKGSNRKKLRALPTFASYEDYAKMIEDGPEDNV